jgi:hypothetical protein
MLPSVEVWKESSYTTLAELMVLEQGVPSHSYFLFQLQRNVFYFLQCLGLNPGPHAC